MYFLIKAAIYLNHVAIAVFADKHCLYGRYEECLSRNESFAWAYLLSKYKCDMTLLMSAMSYKFLV